MTEASLGRRAEGLGARRSSPRFPNLPFLVLLVGGLLTLGSCTSIRVDQRDAVRAEIDALAERFAARVASRGAEERDSIQGSLGYFYGRISGAMAALVGGGSGLGVLVDKEAGTRTYMDVRRLDLGLGVGAGRFQVLVVFDRRDVMEDFGTGTLRGTIGMESAVGELGAAAVLTGDGYRVYSLGETGAIASTSVRAVRVDVNEQLTETGIAEVAIPNSGFSSNDRQSNQAPRKWNRRLPLLAQRVVDLGYNLPLPYGVGVTLAKVDQSQLLDSLQVGFGGGPKEPFPFVSFDNAVSRSSSANLKLDAWLFPFMNVFALLGRVEGTADLDVFLDGNLMLDQLGIDCSGMGPPNPLCLVLEDQTILLPIRTTFEGNTYGLGTTLAGGWSDWFVAVPMSFTYADMVGTSTNGVSLTFTPRAGRLVGLGPYGDLALFAGGNYLDTQLEVEGTAFLPVPDGPGLGIDYTIEQQNEDRWNLVLGGNWTITRRLALSLEYNGFIGSRESLITSFVFRY